jgi:hypothetical protein
MPVGYPRIGFWKADGENFPPLPNPEDSQRYHTRKARRWGPPRTPEPYTLAREPSIDAEAIDTYEGAHDIYTLIVGRDITGETALV